MLKAVNVISYLVVFLSFFSNVSCTKDDVSEPVNEGFIRDIKALQAIKQANPNSNLEWLFCLDDPDNPTISNYGEDSSQANIIFKSIKGEQRVTALHIMNKNISELKSLNLLSELETLDCSSNQINSLDIRENEKLLRLVCYYNQIKSLDVSENKKLSWLNSHSNQISSLDLSENKNLFWFDCHSNQIESLDISNNKELLLLICSTNQIASLDIGEHKKIVYLDCYSNQINSLDVRGNKELQYLDCHSNQIRNLDVSNNKELKRLDCSSNQINSLDVSENKALTWLDCSSNPCSTTKQNTVVILNKFYDKAQSLNSNKEFYLQPAKNKEMEEVYHVVSE